MRISRCSFISISQFQNRVDAITAKKTRSYCDIQPLSPEDALEARLLLDATAWPESRPLSVPVALEQTSSPANSSFTILGAGRGRWHVGDRLEAAVTMFDFQGRRKESGGDFIIARLHSPALGAGVAGRVVDHLNGSYSAVFHLLWEGDVQVEVTLVHSSEAIAMLRNLTSNQPDRIYFKSHFRSGSVTETCTCNVCLDTTEPLCDYTDLHTGDPWFCYKPKNLSCDARIDHSMGGFKQQLQDWEKKLIQR